MAPQGIWVSYGFKVLWTDKLKFSKNMLPKTLKKTIYLQFHSFTSGFQLKLGVRDFPGSAVVKTLHFQCRGCRHNPLLGNQNSKSHVAWPIKKTTSCQTHRKEVLLLDRCQKDMVHQKLQWRLGSAGGQGSPEVSLPYHVRRKPPFIFLSREGITGIQKLIPRETTISYLVFSITEKGLVLESEKRS